MAELLPAANGFETVKRYVDDRRDSVVAKILPGELYVTKHRELITTVLGSCVSACIWDEKLGIGGMNHFMLPQQGERKVSSVGDAQWLNSISYSCRYGHWAMEFLINEIIKNGGSRPHLLSKIFGGGKIMANMSDIGHNNIDFVRLYLKNEEIPVVAHDVGGPWPRKIIFCPNSGIVKVKRLRAMHNDTIEKREVAYFKDIIKQPDTTDIELF
ncbi:chemoreceptor glutamine deamidase CheD [Catenovulum sediminis]|uniref:Probable chemoreceptor glutamine deamidase CheD n=1 Tax=Catenovulum sediminis TaxID=1740262 RepID=A0ABV1RLJ1_9ALTE